MMKVFKEFVIKVFILIACILIIYFYYTAPVSVMELSK